MVRNSVWFFSRVHRCIFCLLYKGILPTKRHHFTSILPLKEGFASHFQKCQQKNCRDLHAGSLKASINIPTCFSLENLCCLICLYRSFDIFQLLDQPKTPIPTPFVSMRNKIHEVVFICVTTFQSKLSKSGSAIALPDVFEILSPPSLSMGHFSPEKYFYKNRDIVYWR